MARKQANTKPTRQLRRFANKATRHETRTVASVLSKLGNIRTMTAMAAILEVN